MKGSNKMKEINMDEIIFNNESEIIDYLDNKTKSFNILDFYNQKKDVSGLIVITPEQTIEVHPISYHQYAADMIYKLLYGFNYNEQTKLQTNNILIRLVCGSSYQFYTIIPKKITKHSFTGHKAMLCCMKRYALRGEKVCFLLYAELLQNCRHLLHCCDTGWNKRQTQLVLNKTHFMK